MRITVVIAMLILLTACGQKGPLYLPEDEAKPSPAELSSVDRNK